MSASTWRDALLAAVARWEARADVALRPAGYYVPRVPSDSTEQPKE